MESDSRGPEGKSFSLQAQGSAYSPQLGPGCSTTLRGLLFSPPLRSSETKQKEAWGGFLPAGACGANCLSFRSLARFP